MSGNAIKPGDDFQYYVASAVYWNDFPEIRERINARISGAPDKDWIEHVRARHGARDRALMVSCGNGWVERDLFERNLIKSAFGFDVMPGLVETARQEAEAIGLPASYELVDANTIALEATGFDLAVNHGSVHHIAYLDRLLRWLRSALAETGIYAIYDYTGAHRNQYDWTTWSAVVAVNKTLPARFQVELNYPHMPTMLATDPTEAIHSELQMAITRRYFTLEEEVPLGGGIAYTLLFGNRALLDERETPEGRAAIGRILLEDDALLARHPASNLFTFAICRPKPAFGADQQAMLDKWEAEEIDRESRAALNGGRYYPPESLELIYNEMADLKGEVQGLRRSAA